MTIEEVCARYSLPSPASSWQSFFLPWCRKSKVNFLNEISAILKGAHTDYSHHFLAIDEIPCNSDSDGFNFLWRFPSGDWTGLDPKDVNLMIALKPTLDNTGGALRRLALLSQSKDRAIDIYFPARMMKIDLHRTYRTTQNIFPLFKTVLDVFHSQTNTESSALGNSDSCDPRPGHGIIGELPEILILPNCGCWFYCTNPTEHLLEKYREGLVGCLRKIQPMMEEEMITVVISTYRDTPSCVNWLTAELEKEGITGVQVKRLSQCRGVEYPVLVSISHGDAIGEEGCVLLDAWTRVTSSLYIIHKEGREDMFSKALQLALDQDKARCSQVINSALQIKWPGHGLCNAIVSCTCGLMCWCLYALVEHSFGAASPGYSGIILGTFLLLPSFANWLYQTQVRGLMLARF